MILNRSSMFKLTALFAAVVVITGCRANGGFTLGKNKSPAQVADANRLKLLLAVLANQISLQRQAIK